MVFNSLPLHSSPIRFGTDGWRGVLGVDVTIERLLLVASAAAQELLFRAPKDLNSKTIVIGFDRRFLAPELAQSIACAVRGCGLEPLLAKTAVTTPACSWAVLQKKALGALVITASHNPPEWIGLKIKGPFGGSVDSEFTYAVEQRLFAGGISQPEEGKLEVFDVRKNHLDGLRNKVNVNEIFSGIESIGLKVIVDPMHGSAAGCLGELIGIRENAHFEEIRSERDPLFGGNPPEPLAPYLEKLISAVKDSRRKGKPALGIVFDGDGDRIAAIDEFGNYCSTQLLIPLLIDHLARVRELPGGVVKTVSGSDLMSLVAENLGREVLEMPVGFKYISSEMLNSSVLLGGEESGGIGFGIHIPERDALFAALLLLEAIAFGGQPLGARLKDLKEQFGDSCFDRLDLHLENMSSRNRLENLLKENPPNAIAGIPVKEVIRIDGLKLRLGASHWLMMRFSGTEPLLRIYCEAPNIEKLNNSLQWAKELIRH